MKKILIMLTLVFVLIGGSIVSAEQGWPDLSGEEITVMGVWTGNDQGLFEEVLVNFTEKTGAKVTYNPAGDSMATVIGTQIEGGSPPDLAMLPQPGLLKEFAQRGALVSIENVAGGVIDENYAPVWRDLGSFDGTLYGVWFKAANKSVMWYNTNIFSDVGVSEPASWDELMETADLLYAYGYTPFSLGGASSWTLTDWFENIYLRVAGPEMYDKLIAHEIPWTHETVKESFTVLKEVFGRTEWLAGGVRGSLEANHPEGIIRPFLDEPKAVIAYGADFSAGAIMNETNAELGKDATFFNFPAINDSPLSVVGGGDVAVIFKDNLATQTLIKYLATPEAAEIWAAEGGFTSPNKGVNSEVYPSDILRRSAESLQNADWFRFDLSDLVPSEFGSTAGTGMRYWLQEFIRNSDVDKVTEELDSDAVKAY